IFQRTPNLTIPMRQEKLSKEENARLKAEKYQDWLDGRERNFAGFEFDFYPKAAADCTPEERDAVFREVWQTGAFNWWLGNLNDVLVNPESNLAQYNFWRDETRKRIKNPALREVLAPTMPPHPIPPKPP
ncbi:MAG TPA: cyclopentanone 1,2-monooxygenase, partial [Actinomycetota bacterium]|nr:cyclopentanone 1,2-monooxygenase [Actinomycetota bacterium]